MHGCVIRGRETVTRHHELVQQALESRRPPIANNDTRAQTSTLPRPLGPGVTWLGECLALPYRGEMLHSYHSLYLIDGDEGSLLVDTGHPKDWASVERQLDELLASGAPPVRYLFPTHAEVPHSANLGRLLDKFPRARGVRRRSRLPPRLPEQ